MWNILMHALPHILHLCTYLDVQHDCVWFASQVAHPCEWGFLTGWMLNSISSNIGLPRPFWKLIAKYVIVFPPARQLVIVRSTPLNSPRFGYAKNWNLNHFGTSTTNQLFICACVCVCVCARACVYDYIRNCVCFFISVYSILLLGFCKKNGKNLLLS
jgi:hypothetical protein